MLCAELNDQALCLQPGAYICSEPGVKLGLKYAGLGSFIVVANSFEDFGRAIQEKLAREIATNVASLPSTRKRNKNSASLSQELSSKEQYSFLK